MMVDRHGQQTCMYRTIKFVYFIVDFLRSHSNDFMFIDNSITGLGSCAEPALP